MQETISITVTGKVQGVFYRQSAKEKALELGLTGTVKNLPNGNVQIMASGTAQQLNALVAWCKQGPPRAVVEQVQVEKMAPHAFFGFTVQR
jgi:acylphosphatase